MIRLLAIASLVLSVQAFRIYGQPPDATTLGMIRYLTEVYSDDGIASDGLNLTGLVIFNETNKYSEHDFHDYDLNAYAPVPYFSFSDILSEAELSPRAIDAVVSSPSCETQSSSNPQCGFLSSNNNRNFVCHSAAGIGGLSGAVAAGVLVDHLTCGKVSTIHVLFYIGWGTASAAASSAAISYCPSGLASLANCDGPGHTNVKDSERTYVYEMDESVGGGVTTCSQVEKEGTGVVCTSASATFTAPARMV